MDTEIRSEIRREPIDHPSAWYAKDMAADRSWIYQFGEDDRAEMRAALRHARSKRLALEQIGPAEFPLPNLKPRLEQILHDVNHGRGFVLMRGFPIEGYDEAPDDVETMYWGLFQHFGKPLSQNAFGDVIGHVRDEGVRIAQGIVKSRTYRSRDRLRFHTDRADAVGLLCLQKAVEGGLSSIASSQTLYNEILRVHPEYLPVYYRGFIHHNQEEGGDEREYRVPLFSVCEGIVSSRISRNNVENARSVGVAWTDLEKAALEYYDERCGSDDLRLDMAFEPGDIQLINNFTTLHARTEFRDAEDPKLKRHLLRMWIQMRERRPIQPWHFTQYDGIEKAVSRN